MRDTYSAPTVRIGADLTNVDAVRDSIERFGSRYLERIYSLGEIEYCERSMAERFRRFAARFAAKEATLKVLRPDQHWLDWRSIEVIKKPGGWCEIELHGAAALLAKSAGVSSLSVSLSHEGPYALATVVATVARAP
jgi:holo-[acyl-carrier protein] synthase